MRSLLNRGLLRIAAVVVLALIATFASAQTTHCVPSSFSGSCDDNHPTIQAAITHSVALDTVLVAPGTYAENLTIGVDITFQGAQAGVDARGRVVGAPNPVTESIIAPAAGVGLFLVAGSAGATIDGFSFLGGTRAIESAGGPIDNLLIENNHIADFTSAGIFLNDSGIDITVSQNVIDGTLKTGAGDLFHLDQDNFAGFRLENNVIRNGATATGFFVDGNHNVVTSVTPRAPRIAGNLIIDNNTGMNLGRFAFDGGVAGAFIEDNTFESNNFDGLQGGIQRTTIQNNFFRNNGQSGLALTGFGGAGDATRGAQNLMILCNELSGNLREGLFFTSGQFPGTIATNQAHNNNIAGNVVGATYNGTETINVDNNWWGSATGPTVASNPGGTGDSLSGTGAAFFDYTPFLAFAAVCVPGQAAPDLIIDKIVDDPTPSEEDSVTFTITIINNGGPATLVSVTDMLPVGLTYESDDPSQGTYNPATGVWDVGTINSPGGAASLQITATVDPGTAGSTITNTATITTSTPTDSTPADNSDSASLDVGQPDLSITKTADSNQVQAGFPVTFTIVVTNSGDGDATSVTVTDVLPPGLTYVSSNASQGTYDSGTGVWTVGAVAAGGSATLQIVADVSGAPGTTYVNSATITASTPADATPGDNTVTEAVTVAAVIPRIPSLSLLGLLMLSMMLAATAFVALRR